MARYLEIALLKIKKLKKVREEETFFYFYLKFILSFILNTVGLRISGGIYFYFYRLTHF